MAIKTNYRSKHRKRRRYYPKLQVETNKHVGDDYQEKYIRLLADFENYKQRMNSEKSMLVKYANENLLVDFLPSLSLLENAVNTQTNDAQLAAYLAGFKMINDQIFSSLESKGLSKIEQSNIKFDPKIHNAIQIEINKDIEDDLVLKVISNGYKLNDKVIMHAKVKINKQEAVEEKEKNE